MEETENIYNWRLSPTHSKKSKEPSLSHISKSVLQEFCESPQFKSLPTPDIFIPFHNERDGLNRLIKSNSQKFSKQGKNRNLSLKTGKKIVASKKILLKNPLNSETPAVGTYSINYDWNKQSFNKRSPKKFNFRSNQSPNEVCRSFERAEQVSRVLGKEKMNKTRELFQLERKFNFVPRKKGIWEDIKIQELSKGFAFKSIEENESIVNAHHNNIISSIQKFKQDMLSIQKYLK
jgi:hypothetical protein